MHLRTPALKTLVLMMGLAGAQSVLAATFQTDPELTQASVYRYQGDMEPAAIRAEPFFITPQLSLSFGRDDNVYLEPDNENSSLFLGIAPSLSVMLPKGADTYYLGYVGNYGVYTSEHDADYYDHALSLGAANDWSVRARSGIEMVYQAGHDPVGSTVTATDEPDKWHHTSLRGNFAYGAEGAKGHIELAAGFGARRYDSNEALTETKNRDQADLSAAFLYRLGPATQALVEARLSDIAYTDGGEALDSTETRLLVGARWQVTAITSGSFKIGQVRKNFDDDALNDYSGVGWEGAMEWSPRPYSHFGLSLTKSPGESTGAEDYLVTTQTSLSWRHDWTDLVRTTLSVTDADDAFKGTAREDDRRIYTAKLTYGMARWLRVGAEFQRHVRDSSDDALDYTRNLVLLTLEGSL